MDLSPWNYWQDDGSPREFTNEAAAALEAALALNPDHTGALHYTIHLYERFEPEKAEAAADRLEVQAPDAGHLVHMPAHIYYRVGRYKDSADVNEAAAAADVAYFSWCRAPAAYAALYYTHNLHFLWASAMIEGRSDAAITAARRIVAQVPTDQLATFPFLEDFLVTPYYTEARFGKLGRDPRRAAAARGPALHDRDLALRARARLHAHQEAGGGAGRVRGAGGDRGRRRARRDGLRHLGRHRGPAPRHREASPRRRDGGGARRPQDAAIAELRAGDRDPGRDALQRAAAVLLARAPGARRRAARRPVAPREAEVVYLEDLRRYPKNGWSLYGLSKSYAAQGKAGPGEGAPATASSTPGRAPTWSYRHRASSWRGDCGPDSLIRAINGGGFS